MWELNCTTAQNFRNLIFFLIFWITVHCDISPSTVMNEEDPLWTSSFTFEECRKLGTLHSVSPCCVGALSKRLPVKRDLSIKRMPPSPAASFVAPPVRGNGTEARQLGAGSPVPGFVQSGGYLHPSILGRPIRRNEPSPPPLGEVWRNLVRWKETLSDFGLYLQLTFNSAPDLSHERRLSLID